MSHSSPSTLRTVLALAGVTLLAVALPAREPAGKPVRDYSFTKATGEMLAKFKVAADEKNYDAATAILDAQLARVPPDSYDAALINQYKTNMAMQKGDYAAAITPMEQALNISESKSPTYFDERATRESLSMLVQLYLQEALQSKNPTLANTYFDKADKCFIKWQKITPESNAGMQQLYSQLLYTWAVQNPDKPDLTLIKRALEQVEIGLNLSTTRSKDTLNALKKACLQQLTPKEDAVAVLDRGDDK